MNRPDGAVPFRRFRRRLPGSAAGAGPLALALALPLAVPAVMPVGAAPVDTIAQPAVAVRTSASVPSDVEVVPLLRATLAKVDYGNKTGDYRGLHAELTPQVQKVVDVARLASALEGFRKLQVDMSPIARTAPLYERPPQITPDGLLLLRGTFPTQPREIRFDFGFVQIDGKWRIQALNLDTPGGTAPPAPANAPPSPAPAAAAVAAPPPPAPSSAPARKAIDSPFLDASTDPPTANKW